jgi:hypothetical protein
MQPGQRETPLPGTGPVRHHPTDLPDTIELPWLAEEAKVPQKAVRDTGDREQGFLSSSCPTLPCVAVRHWARRRKETHGGQEDMTPSPHNHSWTRPLPAPERGKSKSVRSASSTALTDPAFKARLAELGGAPMPMTPVEFGKCLAGGNREMGQGDSRGQHQSGVKWPCRSLQPSQKC